MGEVIIPVGKYLPYTLTDLSVVIPQASQYVKRIKWFIPQYINSTPPQVVKNTLVVYDPEDTETKAVLDQYGIKGMTCQPPHSTYKMEAGFKEVQTRLCVRMHNDVYIARTDWAQRLVDQFNKNILFPQLIGAYNWSGGLFKTVLDKVLEDYLCFRETYNKLEFRQESVGAPFMSACFMAAQTYVFQGVYPEVVRINEGSMNKEDCLFTLLLSIYGIKLVSWNNMYSFVATVSQAYGDFNKETPPTKAEFIVDDFNKDRYPQPVFKEVV